MQQVPLAALHRPPQLPSVLTPKSVTFDELDALNTRNSTQQTAREDPRPPLPTVFTQTAIKSHITLIDSPKWHSPLRSSKAGRDEGSANGVSGQLKFKSLRRVEGLEGSDKADSSRPSRRHKIFDSSYFPKQSVVAQQKRSLNHHSSAHNLLSRSQHPPYPLKQSEIRPFPQQRQKGVRFLDSIPVVANSRLVRVNSCSRIRPQEGRSTGKITFTYSHANQPPPQQSYAKLPLTLPLPLQHPPQPIYTTPIIKNPIYVSTVCPVYSPLPLQASQQNHSNPASNKIKKPTPTPTHPQYNLPSAIRKGTLIDEMKCSSAEQNTRSMGYEYYRVVESMGSKVSLNNNIRESLVCGSLPTDGLRIGDSVSNIDENNSQRYFDDEDDLPQGQRISYKNIDIPNENQDHTDPTELYVQNIFSDFEQSRRQERERQRERERERERGDRERMEKQKEYQAAAVHILQQSTLALEEAKSNAITLPVVLIGLAVLLLLIQLLC